MPIKVAVEDLTPEQAGQIIQFASNMAFGQINYTNGFE
jgi:hypothetical protein